MAPRFPSDVGHGAMRARLESPRVRYATPGFLAGTTRAPRRRQLPTKRCHAALLFGVIRAYQPDSSSKPLHRQPCVGVLGKSFRPTREMPGSRHRRRDRRRRHKPLDGRSFHISEVECYAASERGVPPPRWFFFLLGPRPATLGSAMVKCLVLSALLVIALAAPHGVPTCPGGAPPGGAGALRGAEVTPRLADPLSAASGARSMQRAAGRCGRSRGGRPWNGSRRSSPVSCSW